MHYFSYEKESSMKEIKKILVPVDFSAASEVLARYSKIMAKTFDAEILLLHVLMDLGDLHQVYVPQDTLKKVEEDALKGVKNQMESFAKNNFKDFNVKTEIIIGDPAAEIVEFATKQDVDLIIMGTHGRKGIDKIVFGSVAQRVVKRATCPVVTLNPYRLKELPS
jgi:nucleotide-binding universal stress UspA family protein